jgi:glycine cleavage system H protein
MNRKAFVKGFWSYRRIWPKEKEQSMNVPKDLRYTKTHEWVRLEGQTAVVGIADFAQHQLGDITFVELPKPGKKVNAGSEVAVIESVKAASDIYAPVSGSVLEANPDMTAHPEIINTDPYGAGWILKMKPDNPSDVQKMLTADQYSALLPKG